MKEDSKLVRKYLDYEVEEEKTRKGIEKEILEKGISQGAEQKQREMVIVMNDNNEPIEKISKYTGLTILKIEEILKSKDK